MLGRSPRLALITAIVGSFVLSSAPVPQAQAPRRLALVGGMLLDGYETPPMHHAAVLIEGNKIVQMGPASDVKIPADATIIDTSGLTMMPGMIEAHAHLVAHRPRRLRALFHVARAAQGAFPMETRHGDRGQAAVDGRRHVGDRPLGIPEGEPQRPRSHRARRSTRAAHAGERPADAHGGGAGAPASMVTPLSATEIHSPAEAAKAVEDHITAGVDVIKAQVPLSFDEYKAIVDAAHKRQGAGARARLHREGSSATRCAPASTSSSTSAPRARRRTARELIKAIVDSGRPVVPTAAHRVYVFPATVDFPERLQDPRAQAGLPAGDLRRGAGLVEGLHALSATSTRPTGRCSSATPSCGSGSRAAPWSAWAPTRGRR